MAVALLMETVGQQIINSPVGNELFVTLGGAQPAKSRHLTLIPPAQYQAIFSKAALWLPGANRAGVVRAHGRILVRRVMPAP